MNTDDQDHRILSAEARDRLQKKLRYSRRQLASQTLGPAASLDAAGQTAV
jgi:DNA-binding TFAR19-related protein (PDSD5 family)